MKDTLADWSGEPAAEASLTLVDLFDALSAYRATGCTDGIERVAGCLLQIAREKELPDAIRSVANQLHGHCAAQADSFSGSSAFMLISSLLH